MLVAWAVAAWLLPGRAQAEWYQASSPHFTVYADSKEEKLLDFALKLEKFDYLLRKVTDVADPQAGGRVQIYLLSNMGKVRALAHNPNLAGFYHASDRTAYAVLSRTASKGRYDAGAEAILFHEYTHHFMQQHFPAPYPAWYVEGFAEFFSVVKFPANGSIEFGHIPMARVPGLVLGQPYPLDELFARTPNGLSQQDGDRYYGTAWLLTHYMLQHKGARQTELQAYLNDIASGAGKDAPRYFSGGLDGLGKDVRAYMKQRHFISVLTPQEMQIGNVDVRAVPADRAALMEDELRLMGRTTKAELADLAASLAKTAAKFPDSAYALALLAETERRMTNVPGALANADRAIAIDPGLSRAYATRAEILLSRAHDSDADEDWKAALAAIVKANRADTEDPVPLMLFYRYHLMKGGRMPDIGYDALSKTFALLPQNPQYRIMLVQASANRGEFARASRLLEPLAYSPHAEQRDNLLRMKAALDARAVRKPTQKVGAPAGNPAPGS